MPTRRSAAYTLGLSLGLGLTSLSTPSRAAPESPEPLSSQVTAEVPSLPAVSELPSLGQPATSWMVPSGHLLRLRPLSVQAPVVASGTQNELQALDDRIYALSAERSKYSLGGPIGLMAAGGGIMLASAYILFLNWINSETCSDNYTYDSQYEDENSDCWNHGTVGTISAVGIVGGGGMLLGGGLWLGDRVSTRREIGDEIKTLRRQRDRLRTAPAPAPAQDEFGSLRPSFERPRAHMLRVTLEF